MASPVAARRLVLLLVVAFSLLGAGPAVGDGAPAAPPTATFGLGPANTVTVDGRPYFNYVASAGSHFIDHVAVLNVSARPQTLSLYVTDAVNAADGSFSYPSGASRPADAGAWISVRTPGRRAVIVVPARSRTIYPLVVEVPRAAIPGDHAAAVIVSLTALSKGTTGQRVDLEQRVAARAFFRVAGPLHPGLRVESLRVSDARQGWLSGSATVSYRIRNIGNVKLGGRQRVRVTGLFSGRSREGAAVPVLLPGGSVDVRTRVTHLLPQLRMTVRATAVPLGVTGDAVPSTPDAVATTHFWSIPWPAAALLALALSSAAFVRRRGRRRPRRPAGRTGSDPGVVELPAPPSSTRHTRAVTRSAVAVAGVLAFMGTAHVALAAEAVPYTDAAVTGSLGLCDIHGNPVMAGRITDKPFVWSVVGTTAAPAKYAPPIRTATLQAYQPRRGVVPGDWSGYQMGASSRYTNVLHPMAQSTPIDASLRDVLSAFPVQWEGLVQLRLFLGGSNRSPRTDHYDATDIQVTGDTWHVVRGGSGPCRAGSATSTAVLLNLPGAKGTPKAGAVASPPALAAGTTRGAASVAPGSPAGAQPTATVNAARSQPSTAVGSSQRPGTAAGSTRNLLIGGGLALALAAVLVAWAVRRRSSVVSPVDRVYSR